MNVLILDDDDRRHDTFAAALRRFEVRHARSFAEFKHAIEKERAEVIYLDYDLDLRYPDFSIGASLTGRRKSLTGEDAARLLTKLPKERRPKRVIIHSKNRAGSERIAEVLGEAGIPFRRYAYDELFPGENGEKT
jgi:hypothetical protein